MKGELLDLHIANGYLVKVCPLKSGVGCFAEFPRNGEKKPFISAYVVDKEEIKVIIEKEGEAGDAQTVRVPKEYIRPIIALDIYILSKKHNIASDLIFLDKDNTFKSMIKIDYDNDNEEIPLFLYAFSRVHFGPIAPGNSQYDFIKDDFRELCEKLITNGGICNA